MPEPTTMRRFPASVRQAMRDSGAAATCVAVQLDGDDWEAALFLQLAGPECKEERRLLRRVSGSIPVGMEADVIEHANAAVVVLRLEVHCGAPQPMPFEILLAVGLRNLLAESGVGLQVGGNGIAKVIEHLVVRGLQDS